VVADPWLRCKLDEKVGVNGPVNLFSLNTVLRM